MNMDVRWKQRYANFDKAMAQLADALELPHPDYLQKAGIIQFFEMAYELAWKTMKDYLEHKGFTEVNSPRDAIKKSFETGLIQDGQSWMDMVQDRNLIAHTYDEEKAGQVESLIRNTYFPLLNQIREKLGRELLS